MNRIIYLKDGLLFKCVNKNKYSLNFNMVNDNILLSEIINFDLIKLIYDLNSDIYEKVSITKTNNDDREITMAILLKHFFEDLGFPQKYSFIKMQKTIDANKIIFHSQSINTDTSLDMPIPIQIPIQIPTDAELMVIQNMISICEILTPHEIAFSINIEFGSEFDSELPFFVEKMMGTVLYKIVKRVKQFIENIRM
jgi:hypothetical protein